MGIYFLPDMPQSVTKKKIQKILREGEKRKSNKFVGGIKTSRQLAEWCKLQQKKLKQPGPAKQKS